MLQVNFKNRRIFDLRTYWVAETATFLDKPFKQIVGQTAHLPPEWIRDIYLEAKSWPVNPRALWWKLIKQSRIKND
jgi:hypothetical protein